MHTFLFRKDQHFCKKYRGKKTSSLNDGILGDVGIQTLKSRGEEHHQT